MSKKNKKTVACLRDDDRGRPPRSSSSACSLPLLLSLPLSNTHSPPQGVPDEPGVLHRLERVLGKRHWERDALAVGERPRPFVERGELLCRRREIPRGGEEEHRREEREGCGPREGADAHGCVSGGGGGGWSEGRRQRKREPEKRQGRCEERCREKAFCFFPFLFDLSTPSHSLDPLSTHSLADETVLPFSFPLFFHPSFELVRDITNAFPTLHGPRNRHSRARERAERMRGVDCL